MSRLRITHHAVERFQERVSSNLSFEKAAQKLQKLAGSAHRIGQRDSGERYYRNGPVLLVVKELTVITVYAA